jgi:hypothetical protein
MNARISRCTAWLAVIAAVLLAGCMSQPASKSLDDPAAPRILGNYTLECDRQGGNECWVPLIITRDGSACTVAYVFSRIETARNIKVIWYLNRADGYEFDPSRGIDIKNNNGAFGGNGHHGGRKHQFTWMANPVGSGQQRQYDINVRHSASGNRCDFVDPVIFNRG